MISSQGGSPYSDCVADRPVASSANPSGEVEPSIAVDPQNPDRIAVAWQQDRWFDGASRGIAVAVTSDGGGSWRTSAHTKLSVCSGGTSPRVTDPWLSFGADGALHLIGLSVHLDRDASVGANREAVLVTTSRDHGQSWTDAIALIRDRRRSVYNDKPSITADPADAGEVYAVWHRLRDAPGGSVDGDTLFARSSDGGGTWERGRRIFGPIRHGQSFGNEIVVLADNDRFDGGLLNVFSLIEYGRGGAREEATIAAMSSSDRGRTWSRPVQIARLDAAPVRLPGRRRTELKTGRLLPRVAVDPHSGALYVAWSESSFQGDGFNDVALSMSLDGGRSWSAPVKVNQTPELADDAARQAFTPEVAVTSDGEVAVSYFDFRNSDEVEQGVATDLFAVRCDDPAPAEGDACGGSWVETRLTQSSFDMRVAPDSGGPFLGDYVGLAGAGAKLVVAFPQPRGSADPSSIVFRPVEPTR